MTTDFEEHIVAELLQPNLTKVRVIRTLFVSEIDDLEEHLMKVGSRFGVPDRQLRKFVDSAKTGIAETLNNVVQNNFYAGRNEAISEVKNMLSKLLGEQP